MSDPEPIDFDFSPPRPGGGDAGGALDAGTRGAPGADEIILDPSPVAGEGLATGAGAAAAQPETAAPGAGLPPVPARPVDPLHAHAAAVRAAAADTAFAVSSYPYAPASIVRAAPTWAEGAARGARREPWSRQRRLTMGILLALLAIAGATVIALSIRAIDAFLRGA